MKALTKWPLHPMKLWFSAAPVGKEHARWSGERNILEAGLAGRYTYIAYKLFSSGVSEALVQNRTVHRSLEGLRKYKKSNCQTRYLCFIYTWCTTYYTREPSETQHAARTLTMYSYTITVSEGVVAWMESE